MLLIWCNATDTGIFLWKENLYGIVPAVTRDTYEYQHAFEEEDDEEEVTRYRMEYAWAKCFPFVKPKPVVLNESSSDFVWATDKSGEPCINTVDAVGYVVPFSEAVAQLLSVDVVYDEVLKSFERNASAHNSGRKSETYEDVWSGTEVLNNPVFIEHEGKILGFQFYYDDSELGNPLGSAKGKNKMGFSYWSLVNLPPHLRSNLRSIQLLGVVSPTLLKKYGVGAFLRPFLDDMARFQSGISLNVRGEQRVWYGVVINCVGDMPASNFVGGWKETAAAFRPCRICLVDKCEQDVCHHESLLVLRDKESYEQQVAEIEDPTLSKADKKKLSLQYGINRACSLSELSYFDPTTFFVHDLMHLLYEGVINSELCLLLRHLFRSNVIDVNNVNYFISQLKPSREFTRPPPIRPEEVNDLKKLSYSSSEMSCLSSILPLYIGQYCSVEKNPFYANFILLLEISASLQCHSFNESDLIELENKIHVHNTAFASLYRRTEDDGSHHIVTPKLHALLHLPRQIRMFGCPRYSWCFRYESKNAPLKKIMRRNCNYSNIPFTMSLHHQRMVGLDVRVDGQGDYFDVAVRVIKVIPRSKTTVANSSCSVLLCSSPELSFLSPNSVIVSVSTMKISGRLCGPETVFLKIGRTDTSLPVFWKISQIVQSHDGCIILIMEDFVTLYYSADRFSFLLKPAGVYHTQLLSESEPFKFPIPLQSFNLNSIVHVTPNYFHMI